jgi:hypothetical protein
LLHVSIQTSDIWSVDEARSSASATAAQGSAWFLAFAITLTAAFVASFFLPLETAVLVVIFQGGAALPLAFMLEKRLGTGPMAADHPLRSLSVQLAMVQIVALPAVIMMYVVNPALVPATFAAIGGAHFLPYVWLHRSKVYLVVALVVSLGSWAIMLIGGDQAYQAVLVLWPLTYLVAGIVLLNKQRRLHPTS